MQSGVVCSWYWSRRLVRNSKRPREVWAPQGDSRESASPARVFALAAFSMAAFAANSLLCRLALKHTAIDAASFTTIRIISGGVCLWLILRLRGSTQHGAGNWSSAFALFMYAAAFSFAYVNLPAATGALLLFGAVQITMIGYGFWNGERFAVSQAVGFVAAAGGLVALLLPGVTTPSLHGSLSMLAAGLAWGVYSLRGRTGGDPTRVTSGNFLRAIPFAALLSVATFNSGSVDRAGVMYAVASGALASAIGYVIWYTALKSLSATNAAVMQLSVPVIAAVGGVILLDEEPTLRLAIVAVAILGGIGLVVWGRRQVS